MKKKRKEENWLDREIGKKQRAYRFRLVGYRKGSFEPDQWYNKPVRML